MATKYLSVLAGAIFCTTLFASDKVLNIFGWANYLPPDYIPKFEKQTGIHVNFSYFDSNDTLFAKLKTNPHAGYDIIIPSSYFVSKMRKLGMLRKINKQQLPNFKYLNTAFLNKSFDPGNQYSVPYAWGTTGIVINKKYFNRKQFSSWQDLWNPRYRNRIMLIDDVKEVFGFALMSLGYSINDTNPKHIHAAYLHLKKLMPNIRLIAIDAAYRSTLTDEDVNVGMGYSGDMILAQQDNPNLAYIYPKDGFGIWIDCFAIPKYAPHYQNALRFMNFIMNPKNAAEVTTQIGDATANKAALKLLPKKLRDNPIINPSAAVLKRGQLEQDTSSVNALIQRYWQMLKLM